MSHVAVVTDSTANLPAALAEEHHIRTIPLNVHWGNDTYEDGITLPSKKFYRWLQEREDTPKTSQPSVGKFIQFFKGVAEQQQTDTIVGLFISAEMSGTMASAIQAKAELPELNIKLIDSRSVSMGLGIPVLEAARASQAGASLADITTLARQTIAQTEQIFTVDTLEYLHRGGRIGNASHLLGTMLNLKPILTVQEGKVTAISKVRGRKKSLKKLVEIAKTNLSGRRIVETAILHGAASKKSLELFTDLVNEHLTPPHIHTGYLSPVVGTHTGPGTLTLVIYSVKEDAS